MDSANTTMEQEEKTPGPDRTGFFLRRYWNGLLRDLSGPPRYESPRLRFWATLPLLAGIVATAVIISGDLDFRIQKAIFTAGGDSWAIGDQWFWQAIYEFGPLPGVLVGAGAFLGLCLSWSKKRFARWRRVHLFVILLIFLGPALIINFGLKDNWGRPRPIHVAELGGNQPFESVFVLNESRKGKSFPCGHASVGFILVGGFFICFRHRKRLAYGWLIFGVFFGSILGVARMLQGGHFLSDVIWAGLICYYLALWLYFLLGLRESVVREVSETRRIPLKFRIALFVLSLLSLAAILLATPYRDNPNYTLMHDKEEDYRLNVIATLVLGRTEIRGGDKFYAEKKSTGHGVPTSRIASNVWETKSGEQITAQYIERESGWFSEIETETLMELPWDKLERLEIRNEAAEVVIDPGKVNRQIPLIVAGTGGTLRIHIGGNAVALIEDARDAEGRGGMEMSGSEFLSASLTEEQSGFVLYVCDTFQGKIELVP